MYPKVLTILIGAVFMAVSVGAEALEPGTYPRTFIASYDGSEEPYNLFIPTAHGETEESLPLVVVLHGWGANWKSWFAATTVREWAEEEGYIVIAPHGRGNWFYRGPGEFDVLDSMEDVKKLARVDEGRIYLVGHSMGGWGTWHLGCSYPDKWAAIVPMSSWAPMKRLENLRYVPVYTIHGDDDDAVDVNETRRAVAKLEELHDQAVAEGKPDHYIYQYDEIPGGTHDSALISEMFPKIGDFLRGKTVKKSEDVWEINMITNVPHRGKAYWLDIYQKVGGPENVNLHIKLEKPDPEIVSPEHNVDYLFSYRITGEAAFTILPILLPEAAQQKNLLYHHVPYGSLMGATFSHDPSIVIPNDESLRQYEFFFKPGEIKSIYLAVLEITSLETKSDLCLLPKHHVASELIASKLKNGALDLAALVDIYLRGDDELQAVEIDAAGYTKLVETSKDWPGWWGLELDEEFPGEEGERIRVVFPQNIAYKIPFEPKEKLEIGIRQAIYNYLGREGEFPDVVTETEK